MASPDAPEDRARPATGSEPLPNKPTDSDPWTVPQSVRDRFVQDGHRFYFRDGYEAFKDRGQRLTTLSENTTVVGSLIEIAHSRGWTEVSLTGTERFRREAWREARLAGLSVRGYHPSEEERVQLVRTLARRREPAPEVGESVPSDPPQAVRVPSAEDRTNKPMRGKLLDHGRDFYRHDPSQAPSYFVRLQTSDGPREVWGKDIERAVSQSLSQPKAGEEVMLQRTGRQAVTVRRWAKDAQGELHQAPLDTFRNRWVLETREFLDHRSAAARMVRDPSVRPQEAVRSHPELAGTYLNLRAAEFAARGLRDREDQQRFVAQVRLALARDIERGEPLQAVRLRGPARTRQPRERQREDVTR